VHSVELANLGHWKVNIIMYHAATLRDAISNSLYVGYSTDNLSLLNAGQQRTRAEIVRESGDKRERRQKSLNSTGAVSS